MHRIPVRNFPPLSQWHAVTGGAAVVAFDWLLFEAISLSKKYYADVKIDVNQNVDVGIAFEDGGILSGFLQQLVGNLQIKSDKDYSIDFSGCLAVERPPSIFPLIGKIMLMLTTAYYV